MGERFGNYDLLEKIAVGGMAEIFKARAIHSKGVEKIVCIKRIHPALSADRNFVAMFIDEARLGVSMVHGNIVPVFDFGYVDGRYFLAMEYVEGQDLAALSGRARVVGVDWPFAVAIYVVTEILEGLIYAHHKRDDQGRPLELVHRDVSPSNILVSADGQVKLLDFGIARSQAREFETRTGVVKGKPGYMSPEQAAGGTVDARADVWSCGAVLHELLTGVKLKDGRERTGDPDVDALLDRALAADREERFEDSAALQRALLDLIADRRLRPTSRDLAESIARVEATRPPGEDWDMQSTAMEKHLAAALEPADDGDASGAGGTPSGQTRAASVEERTSTESLEQLPAAPKEEEGTHRLAPDEMADAEAPRRSGGRRLGRYAAAGIAVAAAAALIAWWLGAGLDPAGVEPATGAARADAAPSEIGAARDSAGAARDSAGAAEDSAGAAEDSAGAVGVASEPPGAAIFVDGDDSGRVTPAELERAPGRVSIELRLEGYEPLAREVRVRAGERAEVRGELAERAGALRVATDPAGATISVDGRERGAAPLEVEDLAPGEHAVVARAARHAPARERVVVEPGRTASVELRLRAREAVAPRPAPAPPPQRAVLVVNTQPWSNVTLDGELLGTTPIRGREIAPGAHQVVLENPLKGYRKVVRFRVKPGQRKLISERLDE